MSDRTRSPLPGTNRTALSTWSPNALAASRVAVEERRQDPPRQRGREEQMVPVQRRQDDPLQRLRRLAFLRQLLVVLRQRRLDAGRDSPVAPARARQQRPRTRQLIGVEDGVELEQHRRERGRRRRGQKRAVMRRVDRARLAGDVVAGVERIRVELVRHVVGVQLEDDLARKGVLGEQIVGHVAGRDDPGRIADRRLRAAPVDAAADTDLLEQLVGREERAAVLGRHRRPIADALAARRDAVGGLVDLGVRNPGVREEHLPARRDPTREVELQAGGVPLARQDEVDDRLALGRVAVALVVLGRLEHRDPARHPAVEHLQLRADLDVAALLRRRVRPRQVVVVELARGVERRAVRRVGRERVARLPEHAEPAAPERVRARRDREGGRRRIHVVALEAVPAHARQHLPVAARPRIRSWA